MSGDYNWCFRVDSVTLHHYPTDGKITFESNDDFSIRITADNQGSPLENLVVFGRDNCFEKVYQQLVDWNLFEWDQEIDERHIRQILENF